MTVGLKIIRIRARNVRRTRTQALRRRRVSRISLALSHSLQENDGVVFSKRWGAVLLKQKTISGQAAHV